MLIVADSKTPLPADRFKRLGQLRQLPTRDITREAVRHAAMIVVRSETRVDRGLLEGSAVRFVGTATIGTDHVDTDYLARNGIGFASAPGSNANSVAEYVAAAFLELAADGRMNPGQSVVGIVGVGNVGSKVLNVANSLGMTVLLNDPPLARSTGESRFLPLDELMGADVVSLHVPLTQEGPDRTFHLFDGRRLERMKKGSILVNTSRGGVVETAALKRALSTSRLGATVLDVWEGEPAIDGELLSMTALGTPHIAGYSRDGKERAAWMIYEAACRYFHIEPARKPDPDPGAVERITVDRSADTTFAVAREAVRACYDITLDDRNLRHLLALAVERRPEYFRELRARYRVRREFVNYSVDLLPEQRQASKLLASLGFRI